MQRWLTRDPIGEAGGANVYASFRNCGSSCIDPLGLLVAGGTTPPILPPGIPYIGDGGGGPDDCEKLARKIANLIAQTLGQYPPDIGVLAQLGVARAEWEVFCKEKEFPKPPADPPCEPWWKRALRKAG